MRNTKYKKAFTLVELSVALTISAVILAGVVSLSYAASLANEAADNNNASGAQARFAMLKISELIKRSKLICGVSVNDIALWRADDNGDGRINISELVYIEYNPYEHTIRLVEFSKEGGVADQVLLLNSILNGYVKSGLPLQTAVYTNLITDCQYWQVAVDAAPPWTKLVSLTFRFYDGNGGVSEGNGEGLQKYQINAKLGNWAGNLLAPNGLSLVTDDD